MTGIHAEQLTIKVLGDNVRAAFDTLVRQPLQRMESALPKMALVVLIDALDEALTYHARDHLVHLIQDELDADENLPVWLRFLLTARPDPRISLRRAPDQLDLVQDAEPEADEVAAYVRGRLQTLKPELAQPMAARISRAAEGIFLYARHLLDHLEGSDLPPAAWENVPLPEGLEGIYLAFLERELASDPEAWRDRFRPVLGLLAVAEGEGLTPAQMAAILSLPRSKVTDTLADAGQFLAAAPDGGPVRIYHLSFREFLLQNEQHPVFPTEAHEAIAAYYYAPDAQEPNWAQLDGYALQHLHLHLQAVGRKHTLKQLLLDYRWLQATAGLPIEYKLLEDEYGSARIVCEALNQSATSLAHDPEQLPSQLWGRLRDRPEAVIQGILQRAAEHKGPWLRPLSRSLTPPGGPLLLTFSGHKEPVETVAVAETPEGQFALSAGWDNIVMVWKVENGREVTSFTGHTAKVNAVAVTPGGRFALSGSEDGIIKKWGVEDGQEISTFGGHKGSVSALTITRDGSRALSASEDKTVKVWLLETGENTRTFPGHTDKINAVAVTPDGKLTLSASEDRTVKVCETESGREVVSFGEHEFAVTSVVVMPDGIRALSASWDKTVKLWEIRTGHVLASYSEEGYGATVLAAMPDGNLALSASESEVVRIWEVDTGREVQRLTGHSMPVRDIVVTPDGSQALSASWDRSVKVWRIESGAPAAIPISHDGPIFATTTTPDGRSLLSGAADGTVKVWDIKSRDEVFTFRGHLDGVNAVTVTANGKLALSASWDNTVKAWEIDSGREVSTFIGHSGEVYAVAITPDGASVLSGGADDVVKLWDVQSGREIMSLEGHGAQVNGLTVTPDGRLVLSASNDKTIRVWALDSGREVAAFKGHVDKIYALAVTGDGRFAVSGSVDQSVHVWETKSGKEVMAYRGHSGPVYAVAVTSDDKMVISASGDETVQVWELETGRHLASLNVDVHVPACAATMDTHMFIAGDWLGRIHFLRLEGVD